jgi:predicted YcjX-like family ATPase
MLKKPLGLISDTIEEVVDFVSDVASPIKTTKIAITGLSHSGKTVFITSLIDQLLHQNKIESFTTQHRPFKVTLQPPRARMQRFDYYTYSSQIKKDAKWPEGTSSITSTLLEFESKSKFGWLGNSKFRIEIIDYPGEWILDIALLGKSYEEWSSEVIEWMGGIDETSVRGYLAKLKRLDNHTAQMQERELHQHYHDIVKELKNKHYSNITPGRFLMPSDLAGDPMLLFAPIPKASSPLHQAFKERYNTYLKEIVKKIQLEHFRGFDKQIVLIDIVEALQHGAGCYSDMKEGLAKMLSLYDHRNKNFIAQWFKPSIYNVTFVATKADLVASTQHNNYLALLNEMVGDIRREMDIGHIKTQTQIIASLNSTQNIKCKHEGKSISCLRGIDAKDGSVVEIYPGEMPSSFPKPDEWHTEDYAYEEFLPPNKSYKESEAFEHIYMDKIIEMMIGELL